MVFTQSSLKAQNKKKRPYPLENKFLHNGLAKISSYITIEVCGIDQTGGLLISLCSDLSILLSRNMS